MRRILVLVGRILVAGVIGGTPLVAGARDAFDDTLYRHDASPWSATDLMSPTLPALVAEEEPCGTLVDGVFVLDRDVTCTSVVEIQPGATLDLGGFTLEARVRGYAGATIRNGTLLRGRVIFDQGSLIENLRVIDGGPGFVVQPFSDTRISGCYFSGNGVAIDLFWGNSVVVEDSIFEDNDAAISIQRDSNDSISSNEFRANGVAVNLSDESGSGVSQNTISDNRFEANGIGVRVRARCYNGSFLDCLEGTRIVGNEFVDNDQSGVLFDTTQCGTPEDCSKVDAAIEDNVFSANGFAPAPELPGVDDGISVVGSLADIGGLTIARNVATSNADLGIEAPGAIDGGGNLASGSGNPIQCVGVVCASAWPVAGVEPLQYNFGRVEIGTSSMQIVTISNLGGSSLVVENLSLLATAGLGFEFVDPPATPFAIEPGASVDIGLLFEPAGLRSARATLVIDGDDPDAPTVAVALSGAGVPSDDEAMELLATFDAKVATGDLVGHGPDPLVAAQRLQALRNMIEASGDLLADGNTRIACLQLAVARRRTDGLFPPPDFASGTAAPDLEAEIAQLRDDLSCAAVLAQPACGLGAELALLLPLVGLAAKRKRRAT